MSEETIIKDEKKETHVSEEKKQEVAELKKLFTEFNSIALVNLIDLPSHQLQVMRKKLKEGTVVKVSKKRLIRIALESTTDKKGIDKFIPFLEKVTPALIFSKENAFKLSSFLRKNKSKVAAKPGQIAPKDLMVNAGPTPFTPGPIIGELGSLGIKATVEEGKIVVKEDTVVVKEGDEINAKIADLLAKLDVKPMEIGLNLVAAYEDGTVLDKDVLDFDEEMYVDKIKEYASDAFRLTVGIGYVTNDNIVLLIKKVESEVKALTKAAGLITEDTVKGMIGKAGKEAENIKKLVPDAPVGEKPEKEEKKEDLKEENKEEKVEGKEVERKKMDVEIVDKKEDEVPTAEELAERKKQKEEVKEEPKEDNIPSLHELAEKSKGNEESSDEVPSAHDLAEKKKEDKKDN